MQRVDDSYEDDEYEENYELDFKTSMRFLILTERETVDTESNSAALVNDNFDLVVHFENPSKTLSWGYLDSPSYPVIKTDSLDLQIVSLGSEAIKVTLRHLSSDEAAIDLAGTPWHI